MLSFVRNHTIKLYFCCFVTGQNYVIKDKADTGSTLRLVERIILIQTKFSLF
jgi:hypothetical protein